MTDEAKTYKTGGAFRTALETRLQNRAHTQGTDLQRLRRQVAFDRFLAPMFSKGPTLTFAFRYSSQRVGIGGVDCRMP